MQGTRGSTLNFNQRLEIVIDVCHGLTYLHSYAGREKNTIVTLLWD